MTTTAIIVAAGRGTRAGGDVPKQWQLLAGNSVLSHTIGAFRQIPEVASIILVVHPEDQGLAQSLDVDQIVTGGDTRASSVRNALEALANTGTTQVLIHDGARPLVSADLIQRLIAALTKTKAAAPAVPVTDALWRGESGQVTGSHDRTGLHRAQTPQAFHLDPILAAHRAHPGGAADDVEVALAAGIDVAMIAGDEDNLKLTYPQDFDRAARILAARRTGKQDMEVRLGNGFDVHAFCEGDGVWLCGVKVPHQKGLLGHSDADVGMHALTDAIYGALAEGDIGRHFPPSDPQWKGAASHIFLRHAMLRVAERGMRLSNADITLICERPKVGPHAEKMRATLAEIMQVQITAISVKATTSEQLGFTGREEGIAAMATACLVSL